MSEDKEKEIDYIIKAISECKKEEKAQGQIKCPKCGGILNYTCAIDYNGHVHGKCETENCLQWMQ